MMTTEDAGGCVNRAFENADDGFQTIDLRRTARRYGNNYEAEGESVMSPEERRGRCGWGKLRPPWLQTFRTAKWALFWLCWAGAIQGIYYTMAVVGPALGYVLGSQMLLGITPLSSVWIGAWWIGFIFSAILCLVVAIPLLAFPYELPGAEEIRAAKVSEAHEGSASKSAAFSALKELPRAAAALFRNPTFMFLNLAGASEGMLISGFAAFLPKLIENQFAPFSPSPSCCPATIIPSRGSLLCTQVLQLPARCNTECGCGSAAYSPVCGADGTVYYSPCHAACRTVVTSGAARLYRDCGCIVANGTLPTLADESGGSVSYEAINSMCPSECPYLWLFVLLMFIVMLFTFLATMPALSATLRCVQEEQRSFALGIQWIVVRLAGTIPAPLLFGFLIDLSCSLYMLALALAGKLCSLIFFFLAWWCYRPPKNTVAPSIDLTQSEKSNGTIPTVATVSTISNGTSVEQSNGYCNAALECSDHL
ncbi:unnamed protein product [Leptidea sinapis]|uniref:Kazal-like domain-containing protein n=1 Tax=Leptidea sinapis TaxID=189913 RepID=A0A5E4QAY4_9NEOP|nr:unnamed protein product [Leptidea sinapis]